MLIPVGVILSLFGIAYAYLELKRWRHERAVRAAAAEAEAMAKQPRTFTPTECAPPRSLRRVGLPHSTTHDTLTLAIQMIDPLSSARVLDRLQPFNGSDPYRPLLLAIKGRVLDVREGTDYYGPGGPYKVMAGRDASRAFAMMSLEEKDAHADLTGVPDEHLKILDDWYDKLSKKYPTVGRMVSQ